MRTYFERSLLLAVLLAVAFLGADRAGLRNSSRVRDAGPALVSAEPPGPASAPASVPPATLAPAPASDPFRRVRPGEPPEPAVRAGLVADLETGQVYFTTASDRRWPTASITKLLSASFALDRMASGTEIALRSGDFLAAGGDVANGLRVDDAYSVRDLLRAMLAVSSNESAEALANGFGRKDFLAALNARAAEWGMSQSHFSDPTGLSAANQSTAGDLLLLAQHIYRDYPELLSITRSPKVSVRELSTGEVKVLQNINSFAGQPDFLGGKTGYTDEASGNLLSIFRYQGRPVVVIVLGTADRFGQTRLLYDWFRQSFTRAV